MLRAISATRRLEFEPAREHRPERDVAHQPDPDGVLERREERLAGLALAHRRVGIRLGEGPVALDPDAVLDDQLVAVRELAHPEERRRRRREVAEGQVGVDRLEVELGRDEAAREHRLQLGGEDDDVVDDRVVERLDAEAVARDQGSPARRVPDAERELAAQPARQLLAGLLEEVREDLGVAAGAEGMALALQLGADRLVVVELAVLDAPERLVLVGEGLVARDDIDDAEPARSERDPGCGVEPAVVRAPVRHDVRHPLEHLETDNLPGPPPDLDDSTDATHRLTQASWRICK